MRFCRRFRSLYSKAVGLLSVTALLAAMSWELRADATQAIAEADAMYWFALADGGDMQMLRAGLQALEKAESQDPGGPEREQIQALRTELLQQENMAHDTINGTLPLFRYVLGRDALSEWSDDPWVVGAVRGGKLLAGLKSEHLQHISQLDVCYSSSVRHDGDYGSATPLHGPSSALENEMVFVFNQDQRFFNHHRAEVAGALADEEFALFQKEGLTPELASKLSDAWDSDRVFEVRIKEIHVDKPWWFYVVSGRLFNTADNRLEASDSVFALVRDQRYKVPWLPVVLLFPLLVAVLFCLTQTWPWPRAVAAFVSGLIALIVLIVFTEKWIPAGETLLALGWWSVAAFGLVALVVFPVAAFLLSQRLGAVGGWFFDGYAAYATASGLAASVATTVGFASLTALPPANALLVTLLAVVGFSYPVIRIVGIVTDSRQVRRRYAQQAAGDWFAVGGLFVFLIAVVYKLVSAAPEGVIGSIVVLPLSLALAVFLTLAVAKGTLRFLPVVILAAVAAFGASMTGNVLLQLPLILPVLAYLGMGVIRKGGNASRDGASADTPVWREVLSASPHSWPAVRTDACDNLESILRQASKDVRAGGVVVVAVGGMAGCGKTRMIHEAAANANVTLLHGECEGEEPYGFLSQALGREITGNSDHSDLLEPALTTLVSFLPFGDLISGTDTPKKITPEETAAAVLNYLNPEKHAHDAPFLWVDAVEKLQEDGAKVLEALVANAQTRSKPLGLLLSGQTFGACGQLVKSAVRVDASWEREDLRKLLETVLDRHSAERMLSATASRSAAVPSFYIDWLMHLFRTGKLRGVGSGLCAIVDESVVESIPDDVLAAAGNVLEGVSPNTRRVLEAAACDGNVFHVRAVDAATVRDLNKLLDHLDQAAELQIVEDVPEDEVYAFSQPLVREFLLRGLEDSSKARGPRAGGTSGSSFKQRYYSYNRALAEFYGQQSRADFRIEAADHAQQAGSAYSSRARELSLDAASLCLSLGQWTKASSNALYVLRKTPRPEHKALGYLRAATLYLRACWHARKAPEDERLLKSIRNALAQEDAPLPPSLRTSEGQVARIDAICEYARAAWPSVWNTAPDPSVISLLQSVEASSELDAVRRLRVKHFLAQSLHKFPDGDGVAARVQAVRILKHALNEAAEETPELLEEKSQALNSFAEIKMKLRGLAPAEAPDAEEIVDLIRESITIKESLGDNFGLAISYGSLGRYYLHRPDASHEDYEKAIDAFTHNDEISQGTGDVLGAVLNPSNIGEANLRMGKPADAVPHFHRSLEIALRLGQSRNVAFARLGLVRCFARMGDDAAAAQQLDELCAVIAAMPPYDKKFMSEAWAKLRSDLQSDLPALLVRVDAVGDPCDDAAV